MIHDPLAISFDTTGLDTALPLLPEGNFKMRITESKLEPNKDNTGWNWTMTLRLQTPATAINGKTVDPEKFPLTFITALQPSEKATDPEAFKRLFAQAQDAIDGTDQTNRAKLDAQYIAGVVSKEVYGQLYHDTWQGDKRAKIKRLKNVVKVESGAAEN